MVRGSFSPGRALAAVTLAALIALLLVATSASAQAGSGRVRVMHASPDTPPVDIFVDGAKAVTALAFPANTGYVSLPAGTHNVKVFVSPSDGSGTPALEADLNVGAGKDYTVLAVGLVGDGSTLPFSRSKTTMPRRQPEKLTCVLSTLRQTLLLLT